MTSALYLLAGLAILLAALLPSVLSRFALSPPVVLLGAGMAIGLLPIGDRLLDPVDNREVVEQMTQFAVLLALGVPTRTLRGFRLVAYDLPRGCAAAYYPEANPLVPLDSVAEGSRTPTYKSIEVSLARSEASRPARSEAKPSEDRTG